MSNRQVRRFGQLSLVALLALVAAASGQLSFHNDPSQNSFSIKLPSFQQSFTRYFGNQPQGALLQQQQQQQQQQIPSTLSHPSLIGTQAQAYQQQQQQQQQQPIYYQPQAQQQPQHEGLNRYVAQFPDQPHYTVQENYINPNIRMRLQQQRLLQQQQQQQQQYAAPQPNKYASFTSFGAQPTAPDATVYAGNNQQQPQYEYVQQTGEGQQEQTQYQQQQPSYSVRGQQAPQPGTEPDASTNAAKLIGVAFSPSNEVSQVKFSSAGLKYNF